VGEERYIVSQAGEELRVGLRDPNGDVRWLPERLSARDTPIDDEDKLRRVLIAVHERGG
jgi:hypothetical protein